MVSLFVDLSNIETEATHWFWGRVKRDVKNQCKMKLEEIMTIWDEYQVSTPLVSTHILL
jgi:hypothetical protein